MKKILALVMMICMLCGVAMAEEQAGDFIVMDMLGLKIWLPAGMNAVEIPEEQAAAGRLLGYEADDHTAYFVVDAVNAGEMTPDQMLANVQASDPEGNAQMVQVNGLTVVIYKNTAADCYTAALVDTNNNIIMFSMGPAADADAAAVFEYVINTLQIAE